MLLWDTLLETSNKFTPSLCVSMCAVDDIGLPVLQLWLILSVFYSFLFGAVFRPTKSTRNPQRTKSFNSWACVCLLLLLVICSNCIIKCTQTLTWSKATENSRSSRNCDCNSNYGHSVGHATAFSFHFYASDLCQPKVRFAVEISHAPKA